jgi:hypothetical protein
MTNVLAFGQARGYPIEKYMDDLRRRVPTRYISFDMYVNEISMALFLSF